MPPPATLRSHAREWTKLHTKSPPSMSHEEYLQLREAQMPLEHIRELIGNIWPEEHERWAKDPIPPYEHVCPHQRKEPYGPDHLPEETPPR